MFKKGQVFIIFSTIVLILSLYIGVIFSNSCINDGNYVNNYIINYGSINSANYKPISAFINFAKLDFIFFTFSYISLHFMPCILVAGVCLGIKGFSIGLILSTFIRFLSFKGYFMAITIILQEIVIEAPCYILLFAFSMINGNKIINNKINAKSNYHLLYFALFIIIVLSDLSQTYVNPFLFARIFH